MTNSVYVGSRINHAALYPLVKSSDKISIAVRSNTWSSRNFNRSGLAYSSVGISRHKLKAGISRKFGEMWI